MDKATKSKSPPAFQFYASDWLGSTHIALMTAEQERGYLRLLLHAWSDPTCSLPDDDEVLSRLSLMGEGWFNGGSQLVRECFTKDARDARRIVNEKLLKVRESQDEWRRKSALGGRRSGASRRKAKAAQGLTDTKGGSTTVGSKREPNHEPNANQKATLQSPSPVSGLQSPSPVSISDSTSKDGVATQHLSSAEPTFGEVFSAWNELGCVGSVQAATTKRKAAFRQRVRDEFWSGHWREALAAIQGNAALQGDNDRGWVADFDWFLRPDTVAKLVEGKYDNWGKQADPRGNYAAVQRYLEETDASQ